jgi:hypothetical protein
MAQNVSGAGRQEVVGMTEQEAAMIAYYASLKSKAPPEPPMVVVTVKPLSKRAKLMASFRAERCAMDEYFGYQPPAKPTLASILTDLCRAHGITEHAIKSKCRVNWITKVRQEFYYRACKETLHSLPAIARFCGGRDHTTVHYGVAAHCRRMGLEHPRNPRDMGAVIDRKVAQQRRYRAALLELRAQDGAMA